MHTSQPLGAVRHVRLAQSRTVALSSLLSAFTGGIVGAALALGATNVPPSGHQTELSRAAATPRFAATLAESGSRVWYFPDSFVNQATQIEPLPAQF
jgi:hypothetical protein